jgi:hypothetical protein
MVPRVKLVGILKCCRLVIFEAVYCEMKFSGGNWALVRHVPEGRTWHPARSFDLYSTVLKMQRQPCWICSLRNVRLGRVVTSSILGSVQHNSALQSVEPRVHVHVGRQERLPDHNAGTVDRHFRDTATHSSDLIEPQSATSFVD